MRLICLILLFLLCSGCASASGVLGRTVRRNVLCDDFEDANWHYDYQNHKCYRGFWRNGSGRGEPELLKRVTTPGGGKSGSVGALEIRTNKIERNDDSDPPGNPGQEDLLTIEFKNLGCELTRADQPVFIVRVHLPSFDQWGDYYWFGFRQETHFSSKDDDKYYPSIFLVSNKRIRSEPFFRFRIGTGNAKDKDDVAIKQPGWWTLAIAFDENGVGHYYARSGVDIPTEDDKMFDTTQFRTNDGTANPYMDHVLYGLFSLIYHPLKGNESPQFVIDDYEVWAVK